MTNKDITGWNQASEVYAVGESQSGERYTRRLEASGWMTGIEPPYRIFEHVDHL
jgi:hypothetical protein